ncbi:glutamate--tRNA ligase [Muribaculaceae bacterium Isolate-013 (NCI)]|jgi:glutamyl-tRNA synthetase|nr:glutamate--tRNA ligase [Muribaculaceae bacterium Isolate-013 (NCI)]
MERKVRVRFAPSPTGPLHIGGVRTALYNYLFARQMGGDMILRIEDTDSNRFVPGAEDYINEALAWIGIKFDEGVREGGNFGPYKQSERRDIYRRYVKQLIDSGKAYMAFDTPAELEAARNEHKNFQYDASTRLKMRNSLSLPADEVEQLIAEGHPYVVRFLIEPGRDVKVDDLIRGEVTINSSILDDKVLYKSADDLPTYHLANIVDDHLMEVSHVIRGEEWLPSAPLHVLLYEAFGWADTMPHFVHLPLLLKPDGKGKLSKRDGDRLGFPVFLLEWKDPVTGAISAGYREQGYLPEAVVNFLALLGWNPGDDTEIMSMDELIAKFAFDHCSRSGAKFAFEKGKWFNHEYLMNTPGEKLAALAAPYMAADGINPADFSEEYTAAALDMLKSRATLLTDLWAQSRFFFAAPDTYAEKDIRKRWKPETPRQMAELIEVLESLPDFSAAAAEPVVLQWIADKGYHLGNVMNAFRLAVVGECKGPHMFDITALMGRQETVRRIEKAIDNIKAPEA